VTSLELDPRLGDEVFEMHVSSDVRMLLLGLGEAESDAFSVQHQPNPVAARLRTADDSGPAIAIPGSRSPLASLYSSAEPTDGRRHARLHR